MKALFASAALLAASLVQAHPGHGEEGVHSHATDLWGFAMLGVAFALAVWLRRGK
jgi:hypothetical protein